jgi:hypothetical protein
MEAYGSKTGGCSTAQRYHSLFEDLALREPSAKPTTFLSHVYWDVIVIKPTGSDGSTVILHALEGSTGFH